MAGSRAVSTEPKPRATSYVSSGVKQLMSESEAELPGYVTSTLIPGVMAVVGGSKDFADVVEAVGERKGEISGTTEMLLMAVSMMPEARAAADAILDSRWATSLRGIIPTAVEELVIGGGLNSAIWAAANAAAGKPRPLVVEKREQPGGVMAMSKKPSFWLNSRNIPGSLGVPRVTGRTPVDIRPQGLNYLPGGLIQPAMMPGGRFQDNTVLPWAARLMLAQYADVRTQLEVMRVERMVYPTAGMQVTLSDGRKIFARRVIDIRGLGEPKDREICDGKIIMTFPQFMASMDKPFPLRGVKRAAIVGSGNASLCTAENMLGTGPVPMSAAGLDYLDRADLYSISALGNRIDWRSSVRGRYQDLGGDLDTGDPAGNTRRLRVLPTRGSVTPGTGFAYVNGTRYDLVVMATGFELPVIDGAGSPETLGSYAAGGQTVGRKDPNMEYYAAGAVTNIPLTTSEVREIGDRTEFRSALFRMAGKTAAMSMKVQ